MKIIARNVASIEAVLLTLSIVLPSCFWPAAASEEPTQPNSLDSIQSTDDSLPARRLRLRQMMERRGLQNSHLQEGNNPKVQNAFAAIDPNPVKVARDPSRIFIMGHSAGAQLVDLLATNGKYLQEQGLNTGNIKGLISLDTARLNLQERLSEDTVEGRMVGGMIKSAFGTDPSVLADASATLAIKSGASYPPFLMFCGKKPVSRTFLRGL